VISSTDEESRVTQYGYDAASQLTSVTDALNQITRYAYDLSGNKVSQTDANNRVTTYVYDKLNRRTSRTLPLSQVETMNYDFVGNLTSKVDFNGKTTTYAYDSLNRLLSKTPDASFSGAAAIVMTYTSTGQRASMTDASGASSFTYDSRDRMKTKVTPQGTLTYTYDGASNVTRVVSSNANGTDVNYTFDANNRLATVVENRTAGTTTYSYDATNQLSSFAYPNGVGHVHTYDNRDRLTNVAVNGPSGVLVNYGQTFSPSSHKTVVNESSGRAVNYSYDSIYRLLNESITGNANSALNGALAYGLDPVGNRLSLTSTLAGIAAQTNTFDGNDRLVADTYDANGNTLASGGNTFGYEFEDRLTNYNAGAITYVYDGDGNRVARTEAGSTTRFLIDTLTPTGYAQVAEEVVAGFVVRQYTHGLMRVSQRQNISGTWTTSYYGYDGFGSTRQLLDVAGVVTDTFAYDGFGNLVVRTGTTPNQYLYRGEALDAGTGIYYLRARWYRVGLGRFLSADKFEGKRAEPPTLHKYIYGNSSPIEMHDPSGYLGRVFKFHPIITIAAAFVAVDLLEDYGPLALTKANKMASLVYCIFSAVSEAVRISSESDTENEKASASDCLTVNECKKCNPCIPPVGTEAYRIDVDQKKSHHFEGPPEFTVLPKKPHYHIYQVHQSPPSKGCRCFWVPTEKGGLLPTPIGMNPMGTLGGGGCCP
jgi:RHS repeat-associated protein